MLDIEAPVLYKLAIAIAYNHPIQSILPCKTIVAKYNCLHTLTLLTAIKFHCKGVGGINGYTRWVLIKGVTPRLGFTSVNIFTRDRHL